MTLTAESYDFYLSLTGVQLHVNTSAGPVSIPMTAATAGDVGRLLIAHSRALR